MKTASISKLKNDLSAHLKEVIAGEPLLITDHRKPVATIQPLHRGDHGQELWPLFARGIAAPPAGEFSADEFFTLPGGKASASLSGVILEDREGR